MTAPVDRLAAALADRYRIERELGQGGMATVYLAHDIKHDRDVAIKVLHPDLGAALGAERFLSEIRTTARLQHPHILPLLDSGDAGGLLFYAMPLVTGETLRARLEREQQLPVNDAVRIAREVADALGYAHGLGVIHRDVKPENILLQGGHALVADFGIALAVQTAAGQRMTQTGLSLGTPQYMSPEQAMGERTIDARSDIYSLGAVTYEMLVGEPPFTGPSVQAIVARLITEEPRPIAVQRKAVPPSVEDAVMVALAKLPADRFGSATEFADALRDDTTKPRAARAPNRTGGSGPGRLTLIIPAAMGAVALAALAAWGWLRPTASAVAPPRRVDIALPDSAPIEFVGEAPIGVGQTALALSPDGRTLVYVAGGGARPRLLVRALDSYETRPLAGTDGAYNPVFSPDGASIAFLADNQLKKVALGGGPVSILADAPLATGLTWSEKGIIEFLTGTGADFNAVPAAGGRPVVVGHQKSGMLKTLGLLPGNHWILCTAYVDEAFYALIALSPEKLESRILVRNGAARPWRDGDPVPDDALLGASPQYARGSLLYTRADGSLMAIGFDPARLQTSGEPVTVALGVRRESWTGEAQVALASDGTLAYVTGNNSDVGRLAWLDRAGQIDTLPFPAASTLGSDISSGGQRIAVAVPAIGGSLELWVYDLVTRERQRVIDGLCSSEVRWSADGRTILVCLGHAGLVRVDPARPGQLDTLAPNLVNPSATSRDGRLILMGSLTSDSEFVLTLEGKHVEPLRFTTRSGAYQPSFSPDGHWIAYLGGAGGVFVEPYPFTGEAYRVSAQLDGDVPTWSPGGDEIFFPSGSQLYSVAVQRGPGFRFGAPVRLAAQRMANLSGRPYAMSPDGRRFLIRIPTPEHSARSIHLVLNSLVR